MCAKDYTFSPLAVFNCAGRKKPSEPVSKMVFENSARLQDTNCAD
jgi:hypothetical protein